MLVSFLLADSVSVVLSIFQHFQLKTRTTDDPDLYSSFHVPSILLIVLTSLFFCGFLGWVAYVYRSFRQETLKKVRTNATTSKDGLHLFFFFLPFLASSANPPFAY